GFPPDSTTASAQYHDAAHLGQGQVSGVAADRAWKVTTGSPEVEIAIIDTGIRWENPELRSKVWLNRGELPLPRLADGSTASSYDANGDGTFNVDDYANDSRVNPSGGPNGIPGKLDGEDVIRAFSDGTDTDGNAYVDDIAGWDFFDDDNDPFDASSYASAENHGSGRAENAAAETDNGLDGASQCPRCRLMMLRLWDTFVAPADTYGMATIYAADNGADVQEVALGVLQNSRFSQAATQYAFKKGVALMQVSSDLNTSDHNFPTNYNNTVFVAGSVADTEGLGQDNQQLADGLQRFGIPAGSQAPVQTWFRNSGLTQFGGHAAVVMMGVTGSESVGQAAGAAGLVKSRGLELASARRAASFTYELAYAPGLEPLAQLFTPFATGSGTGPINGNLGTLPLATVAGLLPGSAQGIPPTDPYQYAFTVRLRVTDNLGNVGEDRKTLFAYHDATLHAGWPKFVDTGGEQSLRMADLDGNGSME